MMVTIKEELPSLDRNDFDAVNKFVVQISFIILSTNLLKIFGQHQNKK